ncbi:MAG TPA: dodecin domain-containing protein [Candidatus Binatia bacterium]|jgi:flavin-binding protein dodecin
MNETLVPAPRYTGRIRTKYAEAATQGDETPATVQFVGASDATIAEAVRDALARASKSLRTLDGAGVLVIPQILHEGAEPRFRVTLQVTAAAPETQVAGPPPAR